MVRELHKVKEEIIDGEWAVRAALSPGATRWLQSREAVLLPGCGGQDPCCLGGPVPQAPVVEPRLRRA